MNTRISAPFSRLRGKALVIAASAAALLQGASPALCGERPAPDPLGYASRFWGDIKELPTKPLHWSRNQWLLAGGVTGATGASLFFDEHIDDYFIKHRPEDLKDISNALNDMGDSRYQVPYVAGMWTSGYVLNSMTMRKIAADTMEASVIAGLLINPVLNYLSGRRLPKMGEPANKFRPFTWRRYSFPSGHAASAFALASVLDVDLRGTFGYWHLPVVYGAALCVAESRLYNRAHYLSDVIAGSAIGWAVGTWVASKDRTGATAPKKQKKPGPSLSLIPSVNGLYASLNF